MIYRWQFLAAILLSGFLEKMCFVGNIIWHYNLLNDWFGLLPVIARRALILWYHRCFGEAKNADLFEIKPVLVHRNRLFSQRQFTTWPLLVGMECSAIPVQVHGHIRVSSDIATEYHQLSFSLLFIRSLRSSALTRARRAWPASGSVRLSARKQ